MPVQLGTAEATPINWQRKAAFVSSAGATAAAGRSSLFLAPTSVLSVSCAGVFGPTILLTDPESGTDLFSLRRPAASWGRHGASPLSMSAGSVGSVSCFIVTAGAPVLGKYGQCSQCVWCQRIVTFHLVQQPSWSTLRIIALASFNSSGGSERTRRGHSNNCGQDFTGGTACQKARLNCPDMTMASPGNW